MSRRLSGLVGLFFLAQPAFTQSPPKPPVVERAVAMQRAMADARERLDANRPAEAAAVLEAQLPNADGSKAFLSLLREAYSEELKVIQHSPTSPTRTALVRERLILLGETLPPAMIDAPAPPPVASMPPQPQPMANPWRSAPPAVERDFAREAAIAFQQGHCAEAAKLFADAARKTKLTADENAAWAYCRLKAAAELETALAEREVAEALTLSPGNAKLQALAQTVLAAAKNKAPALGPVAVAQPAPAAVSAEVIETASFRVRHSGTKEMAEAVAKAAEARRKELFERWSGPTTTGWSPKCEIVLHASAEVYAKSTGRPAQGTGHASIRFAENRVAERRLDLRADDAALADDSLPRELTHVVLADLFPNSPPPRWAEAGMAVLATSAAERERYSRTLQRCARDGELFTVAALFELKDYPAAEKITGFYCESVSLAEYLVKLRGERNFTIFLRDTSRYGMASALKKTYDLDGIAGLERNWRQQVLASTRAQAP